MAGFSCANYELEFPSVTRNHALDTIEVDSVAEHGTTLDGAGQEGAGSQRAASQAATATLLGRKRPATDGLTAGPSRRVAIAPPRRAERHPALARRGEFPRPTAVPAGSRRTPSTPAGRTTPAAPDAADRRWVRALRRLPAASVAAFDVADDAMLAEDLLGGQVLGETEQLLQHASIQQAPAVNISGQGFTARLVSIKRMPRFNTQGLEYCVNIDPECNLHETLSQLADAMKADMHPHDLLTATMTSDTMQKSIHVPLIRAERFTAELILKHITKVLQSDSTVLNHNFQIRVVKIKLPRGGCELDGAGEHLQERHDMGYNYVVIKNRDQRCLIRAIVVAKAFADYKAKCITERHWRSLKTDSSMQTKATNELQIAANLCTGGPFDISDLPQLCAALGCGVRVFDAARGNMLVYQMPGDPVCNLHLVGHHFNAITKVPAFFGAKRFCNQCELPYECTAAEHKCAAPCPTCKTPGAGCKVKARVYTKCERCGLGCYNQDCFANHLRKNRAGRSRCDTVRVCPMCNTLEELGADGVSKHQCGFVKCPLCKKYEDGNTHQCFLTPPKVKEARLPVVYWDTETYTDSELQHRVHLLVASTSCSACTSKSVPRLKCEKCGGLHSAELCLDGRDLASDFNCSIEHSNCGCKLREFVAVGPNPIAAFYTWLCKEFARGALLLAHNGSCYDNFLLLGDLLAGLAKKSPNVVFQGSRLIYMKADKFVFKDSLNFMPIALEQFPKALGLDLVLAKGHFPHAFNKPGNWGFKGAFPTIDAYGGKASKNHEAIKQWLDSRTGQFDFNREYLDYCISDVVLLRAGCLKFSAMIRDICDLEPFTQSTTIASLAMAVFTTKFMEANTIGVISRKSDPQSHSALCWLAYLNSTEYGGRLRTAASAGGEMRVLDRNVDGFDVQTNTVLQFHGCFWHGCPDCFPDQNARHPIKNVTMHSIYRDTRQFERQLESRGFTVRTMWEHDFAELSRQPEFQEATAHIRPPLKMEDALFGGRVEDFVPQAEASANCEIRYRDVVSLYPTVNKKDTYPIGHPLMHPAPNTLDADQLAAHFGIAEVTVLPPTSLHLPLLPCRVDKKLLFGLCRTCMAEQSDTCQHSDAERALLGTWTTMELGKAFKLGYRLVTVHHLAYWEETRTGLFADYVNTFLKLKAESSGTPGMSDDAKAAYIATYAAQEGVHLDKLEENPGLRFVAKIFLNSLWGKFVQRDDISTTEIVRDYPTWIARLTDPNLKIKVVEPLGSEFMMLEYTQRHVNLDPFRYANVPVGVFTTSQARLRLYQALELLGERALYCDTDSVIYQHVAGQTEPPQGNALGQWTDEVPAGSRITHFVSGGPKLYAYTMRRADGTTHTVRKCKGVRLTPEILERGAELDAVLLHGGSVQLPQMQFRRDKATCRITTLHLQKTFQRVLTKRNYATPISTPYGFK